MYTSHKLRPIGVILYMHAFKLASHCLTEFVISQPQMDIHVIMEVTS